MRAIIFSLSFFCLGLFGATQQKSFVIVTASYNNKEWYEKNLSSIFNQKYDNWRLIYINDCSSDGTGQLVDQYTKMCKQENRVMLIHNKHRRGHMINQYEAIHSCFDTEIVLIVDGDDWLAHDGVLAFLNKVYQDPNVWLTYGQFWRFKRNSIGYCHEVPKVVVTENQFRGYHPWPFGHLRTFYAGLYKLIKYEDLLYNGEPFSMAVDVAITLPMVEMAAKRIRFISDILYIYNDTNQNSFWHTKEKQQEFLESVIRGRLRYGWLDKAPFFIGSVTP